MSLLHLIKSFFAPKKKAVIKTNPLKQDWTEIEIQEFSKNLKCVISWTQKLSKDFDYKYGDYGSVFRQTNPSMNGVNLYSFKDRDIPWNFDAYDSGLYEKLLKIAIEKREHDIEMLVSDISKWGRIISFETSVSLHEGAMQTEPKCLVDDEDAPPIDTWFFVKRNYGHSHHVCELCLFCWIPKSFEEVMDVSVCVDSVGSYEWLDENDPEMYNRIRHLE